MAFKFLFFGVALGTMIMLDGERTKEEEGGLLDVGGRVMVTFGRHWLE